MQGARFAIAHFVMAYRWLSIVIIVALTGFFAWGCTKVELKTIFTDLLPANHPFVQTYKDHPNFGNPLTVTIMVKRVDGTIYNADTLQKIWDLTRDVDLAPAVDHDQVISIATEKARYAEATPEGINTQPLMGDHVPRTQEEIDQFIRNVDKAPVARKFLISDDGTATIINATFIERLLDYGETFEYLQGLVEQSRDANHEIHMAGQPALTGWVYRYQVQMLGIFGVTAVALVLSLFLYLRNFAGVVTPILASVVAAIWGFGFVGWLGQPVEPLIMVVPLLLVARSFSHCVQFIERYYEILDHVKDRKKAAEISLGVMMPPSVLGIVTDASGLFLIAIAPIPVMERFALFCGFWAMMLVPAGVFLVPMLLSFLPVPRNVKSIVGSDGQGGVHGAIKSLLRGIAWLTYGRVAIVTTIVVVAGAAWSFNEFLKVEIGNRVEGSAILKADSEFNVAVSKINDHFPGLNTLEVVLEAKGGDTLDRVARQAETVAVMTKLQTYLEKQPNGPEATLSFADYLPEANRLFSGGNPKWAPLDLDDAAVGAAAGALLVGTSPKAFLHVTDFEQRNATVSLWYKDNRQETVDEALRQVRAAVDFAGADFDNFRVRLASGTIALQQSINDTVAKYEYLILGCLNIVILVTCTIAYRSLAAGILLLIPVNLSNIFLGAVMVQMGIPLDVNTLPIAAIGIGVGIDYGIYLLSRICEEFQGSRDYGRAISAAITTTGKAIFFTATIVLVGILPWYFLSELKFLADMGLLLVMIMVINMVIALIVVPLLVYLWKPKFVGAEGLLVGEGVDLSDYISSSLKDRLPMTEAVARAAAVGKQ